MKHSKIVICGLLRDSEPIIEHIKEKIKGITHLFKDYHILIVENDSIDKTRHKLLEWRAGIKNKLDVLGCKINAPYCHMNFPKTIGHYAGLKRIQKMAYLRNIYLNHIKKNYSTWDYMMVIDLDLISTLYVDGIANTFGYFKQDNTISGICGNELFNYMIKTVYYDQYAHEELDQTKGTMYIQNKYSKLKIGDQLEKITSGFSGCTIYRISMMLNTNYGTYKENGSSLCEHIYLNRQLKNFYLNPSQLSIVSENPDGYNSPLDFIKDIIYFILKDSKIFS